MNSEISNQQNYFNEYSSWLAQVDNINDIEASQVNGGMVALPSMDTGTTGGNLIGDITHSLEQSLATQVALQEVYVQYSTKSEALRVISEAVQKGIDISENERQDISQSQE